MRLLTNISKAVRKSPDESGAQATNKLVGDNKPTQTHATPLRHPSVVAGQVRQNDKLSKEWWFV